MTCIGSTFDPVPVGAIANWRTVAALAFGSLAIHLDQHRIINVRAKCVFNRLQICLVAVRCNLDAVGKAPRKIIRESNGRFGATVANAP